MEVELKYAVPDERTLDAIWHDERLLSMMEEETRSVEEFDGIYYDTADHRLLGSDIAYRIRKEGRMRVACLKWSGNTEGALHVRQGFSSGRQAAAKRLFPNQTERSARAGR